jgi:ribosomal protein S12 methylthiotransferase
VQSKHSPATVSLVNLGCPKNQVDAEVMLGQLLRAGYLVAAAPEEADLVLVNTCSFVGDAKEESIRAVLEAAALKQTGRARAVVVSGCLPQRYREELLPLLPEVDAFVGTGEFPRIAEIAAAALGGRPGPQMYVTGHTALMTADLPRVRMSPPHLAYVKIAEGCDHSCRFCAIPAIRGPLQSRRRTDILAEARQLAAAGVRELVLISQDTTSYGRDRGEQDALPRLVTNLLAVPGLARIRLHYLYPTRISPALIRLLAAEPRLCRYLDLPLQHADAGILKRMGRGGTSESLTRLIRRIRRAVPGLVVRTAFIAGFPGETAAQFATLLRFVRAMRFERVGVFCYSDEEGTAAAALHPKVPRRTAEARRRRLMTLQARIAEAQSRALVGSVQEVMVDGPHPDFDELQCGRTPGQAYEVDGQVFLRGPHVPPGTLVRARIREGFEHDLAGDILEVIG